MSSKTEKHHTPRGEALTKLVLEVFGLNGALIETGNKLVEPFGLTSARWQVMGAIDLEKDLLTVSQIARKMGLTRQSVQRIANALSREGFLRFHPNPKNSRVKLVGLSKKGLETMVEVKKIQAQWANTLSKEFSSENLRSALTVLQAFRSQLVLPLTNLVEGEKK